MESKNPPSPSSQSSILRPGTSAPDFSLNTTPDQVVSLKDFLSGVRSGVNGTPCFFINWTRYDDSWDIETFTERLENIANNKRSDTHG